MIDLRYNLSMLAYKLKDKLNRKKGHDEEDLDEPDFRTDFTSDEDTDQPLSDIDEETPEDGDLIIPDDEEDEGSQAKMLRRTHPSRRRIHSLHRRRSHGLLVIESDDGQRQRVEKSVIPECRPGTGYGPSDQVQ